VLEVAFPNGKTRKAWIEANVIKVEGHRVKESLDSLARKGITDIATHLIDSGRCAVAHAGRQPIVDPDKPDPASPVVGTTDHDGTRAEGNRG
jgi:hypothetical protein